MAKDSKQGGFFNSPIMRSKIKSANVKLFPEAGLGYLLGPLLALISNGIINVWLVQYWDKVLGMGEWAPLFETLLPIFSAILIVVGNLLVGKLLEKKPTLAGKARPLILLGMPVILISFLFLFLFPTHTAEGITDIDVGTSILVAVGYNLYYAFAWPLYYTSHSALVNLSTRDGGKRGLLSTCIMAAQLAAAGVSGMFGGLLVDVLNLLPKYNYTATYLDAHSNITANFTNDFLEVKNLTEGTDYTVEVTRAAANEKWFILMIVMIVTLIAGCIIEYFFTRERITEEEVRIAEESKGNKEVKKVSMGEQAKICLHDKYWWIIIVFFFLYQFGGMMKNNDMSFYSQAMTGGNTLSSIINTIGAIPTAAGMAIVWPIAIKIGKSKTIAFGGFLALLGGVIAFFGLFSNLQSNVLIKNFLGQADISTSGLLAVISFIVKALGTCPAMYIALAVMALVLDHQEAVYGKRTDGFTMAVYGSIMVAMSGLCNGIIVGINSAFADTEAKKVVHTILGFGVEGVCYLIMGVMFFSMTVEKFTKIDNIAITQDQKEAVEAEGGTWVMPEERVKIENEIKAKEAKMTPEQLETYKAKEAKVLEEFNTLRVANGRTPVKIEY
ncbi:MAG: MFS transporter [Bacilli bacterium]|nr:MFS transporter [Bacilli bacterium]